jgi:hypothetical protein
MDRAHGEVKTLPAAWLQCTARDGIAWHKPPKTKDNNNDPA